ncbi:hypothetical protein MLC35_02480 [Sulfurimonas sp. NW7]|uniref:hypothetical protein n=1 Tax=Sulfurimonas sp. NW7 TaxID=2922727 RepID=UPI003DAA15B6
MQACIYFTKFAIAAGDVTALAQPKLGHDATLIALNVLYGGNRDIAFHSPLAKMMKLGFDNYLYYNKGHMPPDFVLDATDRLVKFL